MTKAASKPAAARMAQGAERKVRLPFGLEGKNVVTWVVIGLVWLVSLPRCVPGLAGDYGTFVSVAERILTGDRLYVDVIDNKGPLFYYELALARLVSPQASILLEVLWVLLACVATHSLARAASLPRDLGLLVPYAGVPIVLTGSAYTPGMTHLPGVALCLTISALSVRGRWTAAGVLVGVLLLSKEVMVPLACAAVVTAAWHRRAVRGVVLAALSAMAAGFGLLCVLLARGELAGYVSVLASNGQYADNALSASQYGGFVGHLLNAIPADGRGGGLVTIATVLLILLSVGRRVDGPGSIYTQGSAASERLIWDLTATTLATAVLVLGLTGQWPGHSESLHVSGCLGLLLAAGTTARRFPDLSTAAKTGPTLRWAMATCLLAYLIGGAMHPYFALQSAKELHDKVVALGRDSVESVVLKQQVEVHTYARAGANDEGAHAVGMSSIALACPRFHHYAFEPKAELDAIYACLPKADALILDQSLRDEADWPDWNAYVAQVRRLVRTGYTCVPTPRSQVCIKNDLYVTPSSTSPS